MIAPESIKDENGEVVLSLCKICRKVEKNLKQPCKSTRELSLKWWGNLVDMPNFVGNNQPCKLSCSTKYYKRRFETLTDLEIEEIWRMETQDSLSDEDMKMLTDEAKEEMSESLGEHFSYSFAHKPNQKQFKEFNPELFKAYINKFSDKDKLKALEIVFLSQSKLIDPDVSVEILNYCKE